MYAEVTPTLIKPSIQLSTEHKCKTVLICMTEVSTCTQRILYISESLNRQLRQSLQYLSLLVQHHSRSFSFIDALGREEIISHCGMKYTMYITN